MSFELDWIGIRIGVQVGWGRWMVAISSAALCVTAAIVAVQIGKANEDYSQPSQAAGAGAWRWAAIIASAVILLCGVANGYGPITVNAGGSEQTTATQTVTATPSTSTFIVASSPPRAVTPAPAPPPEVLPPDATPCSTNPVNIPFNNSSAGSEVTTCPFAEAVRDQYVRQALRATTVTLSVLSPITNQMYMMRCTGNHVVTCSGGTDAVVYLY
jgi:hypothetical protein